MVFLSSLLDFLMSLLRDEDAAQEFERDPQGVLARNGLDNVSGQDVRDVAPMVADHDGVSARHYGAESGSSGYASKSYHNGDDDPVRAIHAIKNNYMADNDVMVNNSYNTYNSYELNYTDDSNTIIDDRDTTITGDDVHYEDNSTTEHTIVEDSFNEDNDGVDNKGGTIDDSIVAGDDVENSGNQDNDTTVTEDSYNEDNDTVTVEDSYNEDNDETTVEIDDSENTAA